MIYRSMASPLGPLTLFQEEDALICVEFGGVPQATGASALLDEATRQLKAYFAGRLQRFDLPLNPAGTRFQKKVCAEMLKIPYGKTTTYGTIARNLDSAPRAVGGACGRNPIAIIIPCHRVLGANGALGGYSGGEGSDTKKFLLGLEHASR